MIPGSGTSMRVRRLAVERRPGIFHATNQGAVTWYEFVREIVAAAGRDPAMVHAISTAELHPPRPAPRPAPAEVMQLPASGLGGGGGGAGAGGSESGASSPLGSLADMHALPGSGEEANLQTAGGLGMLLSKEHNGIQIVVITAGSPAARSAGVFRGDVLSISISVSTRLYFTPLTHLTLRYIRYQYTGDVLRAVDDVATRGRAVDEVLEMLQGRPGSKVTLRLKASGVGTPIREVVLVRAA